MDVPKLPEITASTKSFLTNAEKRAGAVGVVGIGAVVLGGIYALLPTIINFLNLATIAVGKGLTLAALLGVICLFFFLFMQPRTWTLLWFLRSSIGRRLTKAMIKYNPTDILNAYVNEYLVQKMATVVSKLTGVRSKEQKIFRLIESNNEDIVTCEEQAESIRKHNTIKNEWKNEQSRSDFSMASMKAQQLKKSNEKLEKQHERLELLCKILEKIQRTLDYRIKSIKFFVELITNEFEATKDAAEATESVMGMLGGDDKTKVYELTIDSMRNQIDLFNGQIDSFMRIAPEFMSEVDIETIVAEDKMMEQLRKWDDLSDNLLETSKEENSALSNGDIKAFSLAGPVKASYEVEPVSKKKYGQID